MVEAVRRNQLEDLEKRYPEANLSVREKVAVIAGRNLVFSPDLINRESRASTNERYMRLTKSTAWKSAWSKLASIDLKIWQSN